MCEGQVEIPLATMQSCVYLYLKAQGEQSHKQTRSHKEARPRPKELKLHKNDLTPTGLWISNRLKSISLPKPDHQSCLQDYILEG